MICNMIHESFINLILKIFQLFGISPKKITFEKTLNSEFSYIEVLYKTLNW